MVGFEELIEEYEDSDYEVEEYDVCEYCGGALLRGYSVELGSEYHLCVECDKIFVIGSDK